MISQCANPEYTRLETLNEATPDIQLIPIEILLGIIGMAFVENGGMRPGGIGRCNLANSRARSDE